MNSSFPSCSFLQEMNEGKVNRFIHVGYDIALLNHLNLVNKNKYIVKNDKYL